MRKEINKALDEVVTVFKALEVAGNVYSKIGKLGNAALQDKVTREQIVSSVCIVIDTAKVQAMTVYGCILSRHAGECFDLEEAIGADEDNLLKFKKAN